MSRSKVAAVQFRPDKGDWEGSAARLEALIEQAVGEGASLVVCPEMALTGYLFPRREAARAVAEPERGRTFARFSALAQRLACHLVLGYPEAAAGPPGAEDEARLYNAALVLGPDGSLLCNYRKRLLYEDDLPWAWPGDRTYPLLQTPLGPMAVGICMDLNDDAFIRFLHRERPRLVAFCTNWIHQGYDIRPYWLDRLAGLPAFFIAADTYGVEVTPRRPGLRPMRARFLGRSAVLGPDGRTLALAPEMGDAVIVAEL